MAMFTIQRYCATNDTNGNPRRVFVVRELHSYEEDDRVEYYGTHGYSAVVLTVDEGYGETVRSVTEAVLGMDSSAECFPLGDVDVAPGIYRRMIKYRIEGQRVEA